MSGFHKKEIMDISNINKRKKKIWLLLALFMIIILTAVICHHCRKPPWPPKEIWFEEDFRHGLEGWEYLDTTWVHDQGMVFHNSVRVGRKVYLAPYLSHTLNPPIYKDKVVAEFYIKPGNFAGAAVTLASLDFPTGEITAVVNGDRYLGLAFGLFEPAQYSTRRLKWGEWNKIQIYVDIPKNKVFLYHNNKEILAADWYGIPPLMRIWLGSTWINGRENYGSILECYYAAVKIGNTGLLTPKTPWENIKAVIPGQSNKPADPPNLPLPNKNN